MRNINQLFMSTKKQIIFPKYIPLLEKMGENLKMARKRRKLTTTQVAERADISRSTLYQMNQEIQVWPWALILMSCGYSGSKMIF